MGRTAILFDFGGTLDADGVAWKDRFYRLWCEEAGAIPAERFDPVFYKADDAVVGAVPATLPFGETVQRIARGVAEGFGSDTLIGERIAKRFVDEAWATLRGNARVLAELSERYRLGIVSNFYGNLIAVCEEAGIMPYLAVAVDSACVGCTKPDARIFREALNALRTDPAETVFVGDSLPRDMAGAKQIGMPHVWVKAKSVARDQGPCCREDRVIRRLEELREFL